MSDHCSQQPRIVSREPWFRSKPPTSSSTAANARSRSPEIDGLRGIAIWLILLGHFFVFEYSPELRGLSSLALHFASKFPWGVDLFFVISGFLIGGILLDHRHSSAFLKTFYLRRALRIWPLYFLIVIVLIGPTYYLGFPAQTRYVPYWAYLLFGQNLWMSAGLWALFAFGPLWSIAIEEQFYIIAPLLVRRASVAWINAIVFTTIGVAVGTRIACLFLPSIDSGTFTLCRLDAVAVGFFGSLLTRGCAICCPRVPNSRQLGGVVAILLPGFVALAICSTTPTWLKPIAPFYVAVFFLALLLFAISNTDGIFAHFLRAPLLVSSGKYCYFLYLFHYAVLDNVGMLIANGPLARMVSLGLLFVLAAASWRLLEEPLVALGRRRSYQPNPPQHFSPSSNVSSFSRGLEVGALVTDFSAFPNQRLRQG